jgi:putative addiction module component (TIGR02574 family)
MSVNIEAFGINQLTVAERLELIEQIWDTLPESISPGDIPEWHLAELARRQANPGPIVEQPWREVLASIERGQ